MAATTFDANSASAASAVSKTSVTADQALAMLKEGNEAFRKGACAVTAPARLSELAHGQAPFAVIVGCSDSRVQPGSIFNRGLGELFVVRVAGNTVDVDGPGSVEYGVAVLGAPLVVVLGHTQCGAVEAAVKVVKEKASFPGSIGKMVAPIVPAVKSLKSGDDLVNRAIVANVQRVVARLRAAKPILSKAVHGGGVKVVGAVYNLETGIADFVADV